MVFIHRNLLLAALAPLRRNGEGLLSLFSCHFSNKAVYLKKKKLPDAAVAMPSLKAKQCAINRPF